MEHQPMQDSNVMVLKMAMSDALWSM